MKVALYCRVSTDEQVQNGTSLQTQLEALRKYAQENGQTIFKEYIDDGYSGGSLDRPNLSLLRADARNRCFECVLVTRTDRFSRSIAQVVPLVLQEFESQGIAFTSTTEPYNTLTPVGRMLFTNLASYSDYERSAIRERSIKGKRRRASEGKCVVNIVPFGYAKSNDAKRTWTLHPEESKIYQDMVRWYLEEEISCRNIAQRLSALAVPTKIGRSDYWRGNTVRGIFRNPLYKGEGRYATETFQVPSLITEARWDRLQQLLTIRKNNTSPHNIHFYLLKGLLKCAKCGHNLFGVSKSRKHAANYFCLSVRPDPNPRYCGLKQIKQALAHDVVWQRVAAAIKNPDYLKQLIAAQKTTGVVSEVTGEAEIAGFDKAIKTKWEEIDHILSIRGQLKSLSAEELDQRIGGIKQQINVLEADRKEKELRLKSQLVTQDNLKSIESYLDQLRHTIDDLNDEGKRELLKKIVKDISVDWNEERKRHSLRINLNIAALGPIKENSGESVMLDNDRLKAIILSTPSV